MYDRTFDAPFGDSQVQAGVDDARRSVSLLPAGRGPRSAIRTQTAHTETPTGSSSSSVFSLDRQALSFDVVEAIGPTDINVGDRTGCTASIAALPGSTRPACSPGPGETFHVPSEHNAFNAIAHTQYFVDETVTQTDTVLVAETYELQGTPGTGTATTTTSRATGHITYDPPTTATQRTDTFETRIVGKLDGAVVFDQTVDAAFGDAAVEAAVADARGGDRGGGRAGDDDIWAQRGRRATRLLSGQPAQACSRSTITETERGTAETPNRPRRRS